LYDYLNGLIDNLALDHRRGAAEIVRDIIELFASIAELGQEDDDGADHLLKRGVKRLARGQPTMAPVLNLLNRTATAFEASNGDWEAFGQSISHLAARRSRLTEKMLERLGELPPAQGKLIAYSNSSTVTQMIEECSKLGWPQMVYCGEGRPVNEGLFLARKLTGAGIPITLFTDAALMSRVTEADAVWVGGDSISSQGLVNKVGSLALAMLCRAVGIPFISLVSSDKFLSPGMRPYLRCLPQNPREIAEDEADTLNVVNEYYEEVPLDLVSGIFCDLGFCPPERLVGEIEAEPVSPLFASLAGASS